jgi:general L-amino acid transport system permease protein
MLLVILPQALRVSIPPLVNSFIAFFKDTSLVLIIGLFDFLSTIKISLTEPAWTGFGVEAYLFASLIYFAFCHSMSRYSQNLERGLSKAGEGRRR